MLNRSHVSSHIPSAPAPFERARMGHRLDDADHAGRARRVVTPETLIRADEREATAVRLALVEHGSLAGVLGREFNEPAPYPPHHDRIAEIQGPRIPGFNQRT